MVHACRGAYAYQMENAVREADVRCLCGKIHAKSNPNRNPALDWLQ